MSNQEKHHQQDVDDSVSVDDSVTADLGFEARDRVLRFINSKWRGSGRCPICQTVDWYMENIALLPERPPGTAPGEAGLIAVRGAFPIALLVCGNCGYIHAFHEKIARAAEDRTEGES